ncbi:hypothetical protein EB821_05335 [Candidatus Marinimicrobia bacterium PRS2]|nr:hypothetical protein EB821_05335 [Candidatus Marinimicrobia bacterium PRS2]
MNILKHILFAIYSISWYYRNYFELKNYFNKCKISNYKIEYFHLWKPHAQYFSGYCNKNKQKVFIKFSDEYYIKREFEAISILNEQDSVINYFPIILNHQINSKISNIVFQYINGTPLNIILKKNIKFSEIFILGIVDKFEKIIIKLHSCNFIHRDVRPHNIIIDEKGSLHLIDFTYLIDIQKNNRYLFELPLNSKNRKILLRLGNGYNKYSGFWDDAFSFMEILSDLGANDLSKSKISKYLGRLTCTLS